MGIAILPPCVHKSFARFTVEGGAIRYGLLGVKNIGEKAIESIIETRKEKGPFGSLADFCERVDGRLVNRKVIESLIKCGGLDILALRRSQLMAVLERSMERGDLQRKEKQGGQLSFFDVFGRASEAKSEKLEIPQVEEWPDSQLLAFEKALLGFYLTGHPLAHYEKLLSLFATTTTAGLSKLTEGSPATLGGLIARMKVTTTKRGNERMVILGFEDFHGSVEVLVFPKVLPQIESALKLDAVVLISGRVSLRDDRPKLLAQGVTLLEDAVRSQTRSIQIRLGFGVERKVLEELKGTLLSHPGEIPVQLFLGNGGNGGLRVAVGNSLRVSPTEQLFKRLIGLVGSQGITVEKGLPH